jgi:hypothetical protein
MKLFAQVQHGDLTLFKLNFEGDYRCYQRKKMPFKFSSICLYVY